MSNSHYHQTRSTTKINQTISELSSHLPFTRKMASLALDQSTITPDTSQQNNNNQEENLMVKSKNLQCKEEKVSFNEQTDGSLKITLMDQHPLSQSVLFSEESQSSLINQSPTVEQLSSMHPARKTLTPHEMKHLLRPSSSITDTEETFRSSVASMNSHGFDIPTSTSPTPQNSQSNSNVNNEQSLNGSSYTPLQVPSSGKTFDQTYIFKLEIDRLTKELEVMKLQQSQQRINTIHASYPFVHQPTATMTQLAHSNVSTTPIQVIINTDPLQQMKDFVKPFNGNPHDDVTKWIESIIHYFDIAQIPGDKEILYFQYAPAFLKEYAYKWWTDQKQYIFSWSVFQQALITQFAERNEYVIEQQLDQRKQQLNEPVIKYYYDIIDLCKKYDLHMSDKQKIRKLTSGLKLTLYQDAIKDTYSTPFDFLTKVQQLENIQKLIELRQNQTTQISAITKNDNNVLLSPQAHSYRSSNPHSSSNRQSYNYPAGPTRYSSTMQNNYSYRAPQSFPPPSNSYSSGKSEIYCYNCGESGHIARYCQQQTASSSTDQQQQRYSKNQ